MRSQQSKWFNLTDGGCGITFFRETKDGIDRYWHYGQYSYQYSSQFILVPEKGIAVIALGNGENIFQAGYEIVDELLKGTESEKADSMNDTDLKELEMQHFKGAYLHSYYGLLEIRSDMKQNILFHEGQNFRLKPITSDTFVAVDDKGHTAFTVGFPENREGQTTKCIVVNSKACPEFKQVYAPDPHDWNNWEGKYSDGRESYEVWIQGQSLMIKDLQNKMELSGRAINYNQFLTKEYGLVSFIDIDGKIILEFDFAWRYPKLSVPALSL